MATSVGPEKNKEKKREKDACLTQIQGKDLNRKKDHQPCATNVSTNDRATAEVTFTGRVGILPHGGGWGKVSGAAAPGGVIMTPIHKRTSDLGVAFWPRFHLKDSRDKNLGRSRQEI